MIIRPCDAQNLQYDSILEHVISKRESNRLVT
jgi:hypothetical protein